MTMVMMVMDEMEGKTEMMEMMETRNKAKQGEPRRRIKNRADLEVMI